MDVTKARRGRLPSAPESALELGAVDANATPMDSLPGRAPRRRKQYRVTRPYGPYKRDDIIEPVGLYRDSLLARGVIVLLEG